MWDSEQTASLQNTRSMKRWIYPQFHTTENKLYSDTCIIPKEFLNQFIMIENKTKWKMSQLLSWPIFCIKILELKFAL